MSAYVCITCGTQYPPSPQPPVHCPICEDERQYVGHSGQEWIPFEQLQQNFRNSFFQEGPNIWGIATEPKFAIGQRALLLQTGAKNILWDCVSLVNEDTVERVRSLGGIDAIAISHPHYYSSMIEWSRVFGNIPIYLHADDRQWVQRTDPAIHFWGAKPIPWAMVSR
jgi:glyoxylase-like metal-dependent hydrolase (beta-lactamase superfamily II)